MLLGHVVSRLATLGSLGLLLGLGLLLLILSGLDGLLTGGLTGLWLHGSSLLDHVEGGTDNGTLALDGTSGSLLSDLLGDALLVLSSVNDGPGDSSRVLSLQEQRLALG